MNFLMQFYSGSHHYWYKVVVTFPKLWYLLLNKMIIRSVRGEFLLTNSQTKPLLSASSLSCKEFGATVVLWLCGHLQVLLGIFVTVVVMV